MGGRVLDEAALEKAHLALMRGDALAAKRICEEIVEREPLHKGAIDLLEQCCVNEVGREVAADERRSWLSDFDPGAGTLVLLAGVALACIAAAIWIGVGPVRGMMGQAGETGIAAMRAYPRPVVAGGAAAAGIAGLWLLVSVIKCARE